MLPAGRRERPATSSRSGGRRVSQSGKPPFERLPTMEALRILKSKEWSSSGKGPPHLGGTRPHGGQDEADHRDALSADLPGVLQSQGIRSIPTSYSRSM